MDTTAICLARKSGTSYAELARVSGKSQYEVRKIIAADKERMKFDTTKGKREQALSNKIEALVFQVKNPDDAAATEIEAAHRATCDSMKDATKHAIETGRLLIDQKAKLTHGGWAPWVKVNLSFGISLANKYMSAYRHWGDVNPERIPDLPINQLAKGDKSKVREPKQPKPTKPITFTHILGSTLVTVGGPPRSWHLATRPAYPDVIVCRKCWNYTQGMTDLGGSFAISCECKDSHRNAEPVEESK